MENNILSILNIIASEDSKRTEKYSKSLLKRCGLEKNPEKSKEISTFIEDAACIAFTEIKNNRVLDRISSVDSGRDLLAIFHPESAAIFGMEKQAEAALRKKRSVTILNKPQNPIKNPSEEILFTSNVLLCPPTKEIKNNIQVGVDISAELLRQASEIAKKPQKYWYDHPIPVGTKAENNEVLYGLKHLDQAVAYEKMRGNCQQEHKVPVILSVSVTHEGLDTIAKEYLGQELKKTGGLQHLEVYVFGETDTREIIEKALVPLLQVIEKLHKEDNKEDSKEDKDGYAWKKWYYKIQNILNATTDVPINSITDIIKEALLVFGTNGEYGRHYSFLKAIAPLWQICKDIKIKGTFKIDLDQVFPQAELVKETGNSAFEMLASPLWGASGSDSMDHEIELGMIAGALVNEKDIHKNLFTPDVDYPEKLPPELKPEASLKKVINSEEVIFFSRYPQALSTRTEMMTRYNTKIDGDKTCIQRVHVTGGTNGILVEALKKHKPFTPSFIGRAEDQAYILSTYMNTDLPKLGYLHQPGLIMRHDKATFAAEAIKAAAAGKQVGDYVRMILFSAYASLLPGGIHKVKQQIDPFTGSFVSPFAVTIVLVRFLLRVEQLIVCEDNSAASEFILMGVKRLQWTLNFVKQPETVKGLDVDTETASVEEIVAASETASVEEIVAASETASDKKSALEKQLHLERLGWHLYYACLNLLENHYSNCFSENRLVENKASNNQAEDNVFSQQISTSINRINYIIEHCKLVVL